MKLNTKSLALLVVDAIDVVDENTGKDSVYDNDVDEPMARFRTNVARVVELAHAAKIPVIFSNDAHIPGIDHELELWGNHGIKDQTRIFPEICVADSDYVVTKRRYSGFHNTDLDLLLRELGVKNLLVVGCDTNICVAHTLADAYYRNYDTTVVEDATITFLGVGTQEGAINTFPKLYNSTIVSVKDLEELLG